MARLFDDASTQRLETATVPVTAVPFTLACWGRSNDATVDQAAISLCISSAANERCGLIFAGAQVGDFIWAYHDDLSGLPGGASAQTSSGFTANQWTHAAAVFDTGSTTAYINGGSAVTDGDAPTIGAIDRYAVGRFSDSTPSAYFSGDLAEVAVWNAALTPAEITSLAAGVCPLLVRPDALVSYVPLVGRTSPEIDLVSGAALTVTGATASDHPRAFRPRTPSRPIASHVTLVNAAVMTATAARVPAGTFTAQVAGAKMAANPATMPAAAVAAKVPAVVMAANPAKMPDGVITNAQVVSAVEMKATADVLEGTFSETVPGALATATAAMKNAQTNVALAGAAMAASASMPAGALSGTVAGVVMAAAAAMKDATKITATVGAAVMAATARMITMVFPGITVGWRRPQVGDARSVVLPVGDADALAAVSLPPGDAAPIGSLPPGDA